MLDPVIMSSLFCSFKSPCLFVLPSGDSFPTTSPRFPSCALPLGLLGLFLICFRSSSVRSVSTDGAPCCGNALLGPGLLQWRKWALTPGPQRERPKKNYGKEITFQVTNPKQNKSKERGYEASRARAVWNCRLGRGILGKGSREWGGGSPHRCFPGRGNQFFLELGLSVDNLINWCNNLEFYSSDMLVIL